MEYKINKLKSYLSKIKFNLGLNPVIQKSDDYVKCIPGPFKAIILFYSDFELAWAWRYSKSLINKKEEIRNTALRERENVPGILKLCEDFKIPITWATVGHLFLERCLKENGIPHVDIPRNKYYENDYWIYDKGDWFDDDPCTDFIKSPEWYCPDLIKNIIGSNVKHEIGCHTFSHIDCRDGFCSPEVFTAEINKCKSIAEKYDINLKSFVHPGHTIGNLDNLSKLGFESYRTDYGNILGFPEKQKSGLWEIKGTMEIAYRKKWDLEFNIKFYKKIIDRAIENNSLCVFWFHPSFDKICLDEILPGIFSYISERKDEIGVMTASNYVNWLNKN